MALHNRTETEISMAFNRGSDARLMGWPATANPYLAGTTLYDTWRRGWADCDQHWGAWARAFGWRCLPLPRVIPGLMSM